MTDIATTAFINDPNAHTRRITASTPYFSTKNILDFTTKYSRFFSDLSTCYFIKNCFPVSSVCLPVSYVIDEAFDKFLNYVDIQDKYAIESSVKEIKSYPFVESVNFENIRVPTLIINLPEVNRDHEKRIYEIEYNLLRKIKVNIEFYIDFP